MNISKTCPDPAMARLARITAELPLRMTVAKLTLIFEQADRDQRNKAWWREHDRRVCAKD